MLIRGAQDVLDVLLGVGAATVTPIGPSLDEECALALGAVGLGGATLAQLAAGSALDPARIAVAVARLELMGYLAVDAGSYRRTALTPP